MKNFVLIAAILAFMPVAALAQETVVAAPEAQAAPVVTPTPAPAADPNANDMATPAKQMIIVDFDTGTVLASKNSDEQMPTSSMSKTMTLYMLFQALKDGKVNLDTAFPVSEKAWRMGGSKMFVKVGDKVKVLDLIHGIAIQSGNDATIVVAEGLSGTEDLFAESLNQKAKELGMTNTHLVNASGWPNPEHHSTARDLSILAGHLIRDFPEDYKYFAEREYVYNNIKQQNRNPLLSQNINADGIKTGHSDVGGYGLIGSGVRDGRRAIIVINGLPDDAARSQESTRLLDWALRAFENTTLFKAGDKVDSAPVVMGTTTQVPLTIEKDITATIPTTVKNDLKVEVVYQGPLVAPVKKGQQVGTLKVEVPRLSSFEVPLVAAADVGRLGFFASTIEKAKQLVKGGKL